MEPNVEIVDQQLGDLLDDFGTHILSHRGDISGFGSGIADPGGDLAHQRPV